MPATTGAIRAALIKVSGLTQKRGQSEADFLTLVALQVADGKQTTEEQWGSLSEAAQDWNNEANDAIDAKAALPPFPDEAEAATPPPATRRRGAATAEPAPKPYEPKVGDLVAVKTKRGKETTGYITDLGGDGSMLINPKADGPETDDEEFMLDNVTITHIEKETTAAAAPAAEEQVDRDPPEAGDTVQVVTARDKTIMGNVIEINLDSDLLVLKDTEGAEHELSIKRLKNCVVKVRAAKGATKAAPPPPAAAPAPAAGRRRGAAPAAAPAAATEPEERVGVGSIIRDVIVENPNATVEDCEKALKAAKVDYREPTLRVSYQSTKKIVAACLKKYGK